jgi:hypothetical protein
MSKGSSFAMRSPQSDHTVDDLGPDNKLDQEIDAVRNLIREEGALPTRRGKPACVDAPPPSKKKHRSDPKEDTALNWFRWTVQILIHSATTFFRRPDASRILAILMLCVIVVIMPWFVLSLVLLGVLIALIIYFSLGPDKVGALVAAWHTCLRQRDPNKAEDTRRRAALWSKRISAVVDRLPEKWTAGLYLPEFEEASELPEKMKTDPIDRLHVQNVARRS